MTNQTNSGKSMGMLLGAVTIFSTVGAVGKLISIPAAFLTLFRGIIGSLFLMLLVALSGKKFAFGIVKKNFWKLVASGIGMAMNWLLYFESLNYTSVAVAIVCNYMAPIIVVLASPFVFGEKLTKKKMICVVTALIGIVFVSGLIGSDLSGSSNFIGVIIALISAFFYAEMIIMNKVVSDVPAYDKTIVQMITVAVIVGPYAFMTQDISAVAFSPATVALIVYIGIVNTGIAYALYFGSMAGLKAQTVAIISYIDPILAVFISAVIMHEPMTLMTLIGAALVIGSTLISELPEKRK